MKINWFIIWEMILAPASFSPLVPRTRFVLKTRRTFDLCEQRTRLVRQT